jgi:hypothetical protein
MHKLGWLRLPRHATRIILIAWIIPLLVLAGFQAIPVFSANNAQYIEQASLQRARAQFFARAVLILAYRPNIERAQTISDLQVTFPLFTKEQDLLLKNNQPDVQLALQSARPDYLAIVAAVSIVQTQANQSINPTEVDIILPHSKAYATEMNDVTAALENHASERTLQLFIIEMVIEALLTISIALVLFKGKSLLKEMCEKSG